MHYHAEVWLPDLPENKTLEELVKAEMAPFEEGKSENGFWDWWQIGGRWKGDHVPGYDAGKDPAHQQQCRYCGGTGTRTDMTVECGCNGCQGTGVMVTWPSVWSSHPKDVIPVAEVPEELIAYTMILGEKVIQAERYVPDAPTIQEKFVKVWDGKVKRTLAEHCVTSGFLVTVDYHN